jgi:hypothetical protein
MGKRNVYRILAGKARLGRPRRMRFDKAKIDYRETGWSALAWIDLVQSRNWWRAFVNAAMSRRVP